MYKIILNFGTLNVQETIFRDVKINVFTPYKKWAI